VGGRSAGINFEKKDSVVFKGVCEGSRKLSVVAGKRITFKKRGSDKGEKKPRIGRYYQENVPFQKEKSLRWNTDLYNLINTFKTKLVKASRWKTYWEKGTREKVYPKKKKRASLFIKEKGVLESSCCVSRWGNISRRRPN